MGSKRGAIGLNRMSRPFLLDTDVLIEYLRGRPQAIDFVESLPPRALISSMTVAELFVGVRDSTERQVLDQFLQAFEVVAVTAELAREGGLLRRQYGQSHGMGLADAIIAATTRDREAQLFTFNARHFPMLDAQPPYLRS